MLRKLGGTPKRSVLALEDLQSVNPNPTVFPAAAPYSTTIDDLDVHVLSSLSSEEHDDNDDQDVDEDVITKSKSVGPRRRLTPLRKQILELEAAHPDCVLLIRVGEFYELYDHNALEYGRILGLKVVSKVFSGHAIPFTGFPVRQLDRHLETLVAKHHLKVALCEQYQQDLEGTLSRSFRRSVHRIITPGTLIDEQFLDQGENNWLLAVATDKSHLLGLSWLDLSTGDFFTQETTYDSFPNDLARIRPREIILNSKLKGDTDHPVLQTINQLGHYVVNYEKVLSATQMSVQDETLKEVEDQLRFDRQHLQALSNREQSACLSILRYINHTQMGRKPVVQQPIEWQDDSIVKIDRNTIEALELVRTLRDASRTGSLLHHLDKTRTKAGSRLLSDWLTSPLTNIGKINRRLDMVEFFGQDSHLMNDIDIYLTDCRDAQRAVQKLSLGQISPQDLVAIRITLEALQKIKDRMADKLEQLEVQQQHATLSGSATLFVPALVRETVENIDGLEHICKLIRDVVDESMDEHQEYGFINEGVSPTLNKLHIDLRELKRRRKTLLESWTNHLGGIKPFEIKSSFGYRHVVELKSTITAERLREILGGAVVDVSHTDKRRTRVRYQVPVFSELMDSIESTEAQIVQEEKGILNATRSEILEDSTAIIQNCRLIAQLDVLLAFSKMMLERQYVRPVLHNGLKSTVVSGRHPVVELALQNEGRHFVENTCSVGQDELVWLLTGPNMGGKSTFLRQNAIITIMAQMGCFVPAASAYLGTVDKVFSRLGASDNLANSQSTFMIEMNETASILHHATERSLVIMDEVGRGTATLDGCAIAYATLHHLYHINKCRTLFATHYHELADMVGAVHGSYYGYDQSQRLLTSSTEADGNNSDQASDVVAVVEEEEDKKDVIYRVQPVSWRGQEPLEHVRCYQTTLEKQKDGSFAYMHHVIPGVCRKSHGIHVAKLAGMPSSAVEVSERILRVLQDS
ncbi:DNA mismatch repair ATPase msh1 [Mortierella sp. GBA43]|nr:DNA mismatch repair ATPase msh1 [Mortierella sp. GBA43]